MHPRNPYSLLPPDFAALAASSVGEELRPFLFKNALDLTSIDFKRPEAVRALTRTLLFHDFKLNVNIPEDRLCPTVANRLDYLLWIQDVLLASSPSSNPSSPQPVRGLDIGTGSTAIYPLLGTRHFPGWTFCATEIDPDSHHHAQANISRNWASEKIKLVKTTKADPIFLPFRLDPDASFDFTMCNPPFYSSEAEILELASNKMFTPHAVCTGAETEMITPGGEVAFVKRMVEESLAFGGRCRWFTSLLGKSSSVGEIVQFLREKKITNYALSDSVQGHSKRWSLAWSHQHFYLPDVRLPSLSPSHLSHRSQLPSVFLPS
ncbi:ribosomal RNA large subunit methyltransferase F-like protein [Mrakia frigida]|uniref:ribosomal RNA large subunit methyltransferase F-like protein n=1 Tax=Mrakia frigida TaxID=29902 RepID=UPI003FCBF58E